MNPHHDESHLQGWDLQTHTDTPWTSMSAPEITQFLEWHPTYMMGPKEASDWWAGVEAGIRRELEGRAIGRTYKQIHFENGVEQVWIK